MEIIKIQNKEFTSISANGYLLHSKRNPKREAQKFAEQNYKKNYLHVLYGLGAGYFAEELYGNLTPTDQLIVIEPSEEIFDIYQSRINSDNAFANIEIVSSADPVELKKKITLAAINHASRIQFICSPNYDKINPEEYLKVLSVVKEVLSLNEINANTRILYSDKWQENTLKNISSFSRSETLNTMEGSVKKPVVVVSGGPSVTKQLPHLKENREKLYIICAGSTINSLLKADIKPDMVVAIDGSDENYKHFIGLDLNGVLLAYNPMVHYLIPKEHKGDLVVFNLTSEQGASKWLNTLLEQEVQEVKGGFSVAHYAYDIACYITDQPITFIGQDLAYTNNQTHAEGNRRMKSITADEKVHHKRFYVEGYYGDKVLSDNVFIGMKNTFEDIFQQNGPDALKRTYNSTEGGIKLNHIEQISFSDFIKRFSKNDEFTNEITIPEQDKVYNRAYFDAYLDRMLTNFADLERYSYEVKVIHEKKLKNPNMMISSKKLSNLESKIKEIVSNNLLSITFAPLIYQFTNSLLEQENESADARQRRVYEKGLNFYSGIVDISKRNQQWIKESKEMLGESE